MSVRGAIAAYLEANDHGTVATNIWLGDLPTNTTYPAWAVKRYGGEPIETFGESEMQPLVQLVHVGKPYEAEEAEAEADAVWHLLVAARDIDLDGTHIQVIESATLPLDLGPDGNGRPRYSINFKVTQ